jgi:glycosyltransferase involved in cell wall biosynthesis
MNRLPIAVFIGTYLPFSETFIHDQIQRLKRFTAHVFAYGKGPYGRHFPYGHKTILSFPEKLLYNSFGLAPRFSRSLSRLRPVLIHAHFGPNGVMAFPFARKQGIPLVVTFHGHDIGGLLGRNKYTLRYGRYNLFSRRMFDYASLFLAASEEIARMLHEELKVPEHKIRLHRLGIDTGKFAYIDRREKPAHIIMIGRFVEKKGFEYGLKAFAEVKKKFPDIKLTLVGEGPKRGLFDKIVHDKGIHGAVSFPGVLTQNRLRAILASSDIIMAPSVITREGDRESGILVLKEGGATGLPCIGTLHGGIPEIIKHGKTGFLVPERDAISLAEYLKRLVSNYSLRMEMGKNARIKMEKEYNIETQTARLESFFNDVLNGRGFK